MNISMSKFNCNKSYLKVVNNKSIMFKQLIQSSNQEFSKVGEFSWNQTSQKNKPCNKLSKTKIL